MEGLPAQVFHTQPVGTGKWGKDVFDLFVMGNPP